MGNGYRLAKLVCFTKLTVDGRVWLAGGGGQGWVVYIKVSRSNVFGRLPLALACNKYWIEGCRFGPRRKCRFSFGAPMKSVAAVVLLWSSMFYMQDLVQISTSYVSCRAPTWMRASLSASRT